MNYKKLLDFQSKVNAISKDSVNPFFKSNYFDINHLLSEIKPLLSELGIVIMQPLTNIDGRPALRTVLVDAETGEVLSDDCVVMPDLQDPQKMGACATYYRRYAIQSLLSLQALDDDGNTASGKTNAPRATTSPNKAPTTAYQQYKNNFNKAPLPEQDLPILEVPF